MEKMIQVGQHFALVDEDDFDFLDQFNWFPQAGQKTIYALLSGKVQKGLTLPSRLMHKLITGFDQTDHANGNGLDNRRENLRVADRSQQMANRSRRDTKRSSQFKGVYPSDDRWRARIQVDKRAINIGCFATEVEAAIAYDEAATCCFGEYARLNFPTGGK